MRTQSVFCGQRQFFQFGASEDVGFYIFSEKILPHIANFALNLDIVKNAVFPLVSQIGINYRKSPLSKAASTMPLRLATVCRTFWSKARAFTTVFASRNFTCWRFPTAATPVAEDAGDGEFLDSILFPLYPNISEIFGSAESFCVVLRPDNYIGSYRSGRWDNAAKIIWQRFWLKPAKNWARIGYCGFLQVITFKRVSGLFFVLSVTKIASLTFRSPSLSDG